MGQTLSDPFALCNALMMKSRPLILLLALLSLASNLVSAELELTLMTYNLRLDIASDGPDQWSNRKAALADQVAFLAPDVLGVQEALPQQLAYLEERLPAYAYLGVGRDGGDKAGEHTALFYRRDRLRVLSSATFWLSETPTVPSMGWDAAYPRICTYARFEDRKSGRKFWIFNTHLDNKGSQARLAGAKLLLKKMAEINPNADPCFLTGDFNALPSDAPIQRILRDFDDAHATCSGAIMGPEATYNDFLYDTQPTRRIDYIFCRGEGIEVTAHATLNNTINHRHLSDHFPVFIRARLK